LIILREKISMRNSTKLIMGMLALTLGATSCSTSDDDVKPIDEINAHLYMGSWNGTFSGDDDGTWTIEADSIGVFTGVLTSNQSGSDYDIQGSVDASGTFTAIILVNADTIDFTGQGKDGNSASGTWKNPGLFVEGTWEGTKD
jgi:hypothetical protein